MPKPRRFHAASPLLPIICVPKLSHVRTCNIHTSLSEAIITVENLGKRYRLGADLSSERYTALRDVIARRAAAPFRALGAKVGKWKSANGSGPSHLPTFEPSHAAPEEFWALRKIGFGFFATKIPSMSTSEIITELPKLSPSRASCLLVGPAVNSIS